jgi:hypothetical protein
MKKNAFTLAKPTKNMLETAIFYRTTLSTLLVHSSTLFFARTVPKPLNFSKFLYTHLSAQWKKIVIFLLLLVWLINPHIWHGTKILRLSFPWQFCSEKPLTTSVFTSVRILIKKSFLLGNEEWKPENFDFLRHFASFSV